MSERTETEDKNRSIPNLIELGSSKKENKKNKNNKYISDKVEENRNNTKKKSDSALVITKVQAQKAKNRFNIYINDEYSFAVDDSILVKHRLIKGKELDNETIEVLKVKGELSKAYQAALHYLNYKMRTEKEIRDYLSKKRLCYHRTCNRTFKRTQTDQ